MEAGLAEAKSYAATAIAAERRLARDLEQNRASAQEWRNKARQALESDREDLARRALARKKEHDDLVNSLEVQHASAVQTTAKVKSALRALEARLADARRRQRSLLARHRAVQAQLQLQRTLGARLPDPGTPGAKFVRLENRLTDMEDDLQARLEVDHLLEGVDGEFEDLENSKDIEQELEALKKEMA
jgi:phage shock protein A